ncbi:MAG: hypothetical protein AAF125_13560 [Chloroflexota bacterium]
MDNTDPKSPLNVFLACVGGVGLVGMSLGLGIGVVQGEAANMGLFNALFFGGLVLLIGASLGWFGAAQPYKHFDDINVPQYTGHDHHDDEH